MVRYWSSGNGSYLGKQRSERIKAGETTGEFPEIEYVFEHFRDMCEKGYFGTPAGAMDESSAQMAFTNGTVAMIFEGTWNNSLFRDLDFEVGRFALPDNNGVRAAQTGYSNQYLCNIQQMWHPEQAFKYMILTHEEAQKVLLTICQFLPWKELR